MSCSAYRLSDVLFLKDPQKSVNTKLMLDRVSDENCEEADLLTKHFAKLTLHVRVSTRAALHILLD